LVAAALPCLFILRYVGWRPLLIASWALYLWYRVSPHPLTMAGFESSFPLLSWQLLFTHGLAIGYHRDDVTAFANRLPRLVLPAAVAATAAFAVFAFCSPWANGPAWLQLPLVSSDRFATIYGHYFGLSELRAGRLLNLALGLPVGLVAVTHAAIAAHPFARVFVILGQRSLGAFVLHVYGLLLLAHMQIPDGVIAATLAQIALVLAIAGSLSASQLLRARRRRPTLAPAPPARPARPLAA